MSAKWGPDRIIVSYVIDPSAQPSETFISDTLDPNTMIHYMMAIDWNGTTISGPFQVPFCMSSADDMELLSDGSIIWSFVNTTGVLSLQKITNPSADCPILPALGENFVALAPIVSTSTATKMGMAGIGFMFLVGVYFVL